MATISPLLLSVIVDDVIVGPAATGANPPPAAPSFLPCGAVQAAMPRRIQPTANNEIFIRLELGLMNK
jgi:hypothetical protein